MNIRLACSLLLVLGLIWAGCANISTPTGGRRDKTPPKLTAITPADSLTNTRVKRLELDFDEYIVVGDVQKEMSIMPLLPIDPTLSAINKHAVLKIVDSLLEPNTTYRITFGNAIKDLHEGNPFANYTYTFSTGSYFDSLRLSGVVISAATGLPDTTGVIAVLYNAADNDSAVVKKKPKYMTRVNNRGEFIFRGLPARNYRVYAVKDANTNLIYDGEGEQVAFDDTVVVPGNDTLATPVTLRLFAEIPDTAARKKSKDKSSQVKKTRIGGSREVVADTNFTYATNLDTSSTLKRSFDINKPVRFTFTKPPLIDNSKISLTWDSAGTRVAQPFTIVGDTLHLNDVLLKADWRENKLYRLQLDSAFAKDTSGRAMPQARFAFRTTNDDDYGKIKVNLPGRYYSGGPDYNYVLLVKGDDDTVYQKTVFDTTINLVRLKPANYTFRIIVDKNKNGKWDTGDLLGHKQPEVVIPSPASVKLKTGWEHSIDFEEKAKPKLPGKGGIKGK